MKLLVVLIVISLVTVIVYFCASRILSRRKTIAISTLVAILLLGFVARQMYRDATAADTWCTTGHTTTSVPPAQLKSAMDYYTLGNYDYDTGNCQQAVVDYTTSIQLNPNYAQAFNNRAYTYMRLRDYQDALPDLDKDLALNPNYIQALMNRGDIHNYYWAIDKPRAIADYEKVIALGGQQGTSVCGHLFLAQHNGWNLGTLLDLPGRIASCQ